MSDLAKTGIFAGVAVVALALAIVASVGGRATTDADDALNDLFPDFKDAGKAAGMEIVKVVDGELHRFKVQKQPGGLWVLPEHHNYPADANTHLADVATSVTAKKRGSKVTDQRNDHKTYGVVEPAATNTRAEGVGDLIVFTDKNEKPLAELIVGKEDDKGMRFVRIRGQDRVYRVKIDGDKFSTNFEDWIERDLLKLESWNIKQIIVDDYIIDLAGVQGLLQRLVKKQNDQLVFDYDDKKTEKRWSMEDLPEGSELVESKLNDLRDAFADVKIVHVHPKPDGLTDYLAGKTKGLRDEGDEISLQRHGFFIDRGRLACSSGEVIVRMKDGIIYHLHFGSIAEKTLTQKENLGKKPADKAAEAKPKEPEKKTAKKAANKDGETKTEKKDAEKKDAKKKGAEKKGAEKKDSEKKDPEKKEAKSKADEKTEGEKTEGEKKEDKEGEKEGSNRYLFIRIYFDKDLVEKPEIKPLPGDSLLKDVPVKAEKEKSKDAKQPKDKKAKDEKAKDEKAKDKKAAGEKSEPKEADANDTELVDTVKELLRLNEEGLVDKADYEADRKPIASENQRERDRYKDALENGEKKKDELNQRFAAWYYIIDDEMFKKIVVKRDDVVKKPEKKKEEEKKGKEKNAAGKKP